MLFPFVIILLNFFHIFFPSNFNGFFKLMPSVLLVFSLLPLVVFFFLSFALLFYSTGRVKLSKNTTKSKSEDTSKTKSTSLKTQF
jgi:uncharacterized membrane protein